MKYLAIGLILVFITHPLRAVSVFKINAKPEEIQKFINLVDGSDLTAIQYAPKTHENPLPRNAKGEFVHQGHVMADAAGDYKEEHYDTHDYHGHDGVGQYLYGYEDRNQAKNEKRDLSGTVKGAYKYRLEENGYELIVKYYADATGFHAEDNRPEYLKSPPTKTPAIQKAEEKHLELWNGIAKARGHHTAEMGGSRVTELHNNVNAMTPEGLDKHTNNIENNNANIRGFFYATDFNLPHLRRKNEN